MMFTKQPITRVATLILFFFTIGVKPCHAQEHVMTETDFGLLSFLEGEWVRLGTPPDREGYEQWSKISATEMHGSGVSMQNGDTLFVEKLRLVLNDGKISYIADVAQNQAPVGFTITSMGTNRFVSENPSHDFPKKITYRLDGDVLMAQISGDGKTFTYRFKRKP